MTPLLPLNHHAGQGSFEGLPGVLLGLMMAATGGATARALAEIVALEPGDRVVDVGCGPGTAAREAARRGAEVIGVEPAQTLRRLAERLGSEGGRVRWVDGLAERLPLPDASASVLWSVRSVHHWPDLEGGLAEARRVLAPGGRLALVEKRTRPGATGLGSHGWTEEQAARAAALLAERGFVEARVDERAAGLGRVLIVHARRGAGA